MIDRLGRPHLSLRLSVTDRCNLRCSYCMPEPNYTWLPTDQILSFEETARIASVFASLGTRAIRLTGGEPLLRRDLPTLVRFLAKEARFEDLAMTTNGVLLAEHARALRDAGLKRVTVSLDTLHRDRFLHLSRRDELGRVLEGIDQAIRAGFSPLKLNAVVVRGTNDDEIIDLLNFARGKKAELRFIEYMDVGGATHWDPSEVVPRTEILEKVASAFGSVEPVELESNAPAERFRLPDGTLFGIIASTTSPFCRTCARSRLTADGMWFHCLYAAKGISLRDLLRSGVTDVEIAHVLRHTWSRRSDRGAEERLAALDRGPTFPLPLLQSDPHLEMHTRGG